MKYTTKRTDIQFLLDWMEGWKIDGEYPKDFHYGRLNNTIKDQIKQALLEDQGFICCYTGHEIILETSHIEHIKPQSVCREEGKLLETLDYNNLLAAYPQSPKGYLGERGCEYGAQARGSAILLVTPLSYDCEERFKYLANGHVVADNEDTDAGTVITNLHLDHDRLVNIRKEIIAEIFSQLRQISTKTSDIVSALEILFDSVYNKDADGKLRPFCFVIRGIAADTLKQINSIIPGAS